MHYVSSLSHIKCATDKDVSILSLKVAFSTEFEVDVSDVFSLGSQSVPRAKKLQRIASIYLAKKSRSAKLS